jgi:hypothetical protein
VLDERLKVSRAYSTGQALYVPAASQELGSMLGDTKESCKRFRLKNSGHVAMVLFQSANALK